MYFTIIDIIEYLIKNNIDIMLKTLVFSLSYVYCLLGVVSKQIGCNSSNIKILNITIYLSIYLAIIYTNDFEFELKDMITLLLNYDNVVNYDMFISCLNNLFIKLNCFYPKNIYDPSMESEEVIELISYYLQPKIIQKITPKNYVYDNRINIINSSTNKNIKLTKNILTYLKVKYEHELSLAENY